MNSYLLIGIMFYSTIALARRDTFNNADLPSVIRGLVFGVLLWPLAMIYVIFDYFKKSRY